MASAAETTMPIPKDSSLEEEKQQRIYLSPVEQTMLTTLHTRAMDASSPNPILNDIYARDILSRLDEIPPPPTNLLPSNPLYANYSAARAKQLDKWCLDYLLSIFTSTSTSTSSEKGEEEEEVEEITVLHLACGLDMRYKRVLESPSLLPLLQPPPPLLPPQPQQQQQTQTPDGKGKGRKRIKVNWIDIDKPDVISLRRRLLITPPSQEGEKEGEKYKYKYKYTLLPINLTNPDTSWIEKHISISIPQTNPNPKTKTKTKPTRKLIIIAEGLFPYLSPAESKLLLNKLISANDDTGILLMDTVGTLLTRFQRLMPLYKKTGVKMQWGVDNGQEVAEAHGKLRFVEAVTMGDLVPGGSMPPAFGAWTPFFKGLSGWKTYGQVLRLEF
ncbi:S-adenosyl-L-methionine-dependent methyltransferase [Poronia punctata]|nr:S-adenosyl-L-methionine-dependent methyltransferase [Poronia punctata]